MWGNSSGLWGDLCATVLCCELSIKVLFIFLNQIQAQKWFLHDFILVWILWGTVNAESSAFYLALMAYQVWESGSTEEGGWAFPVNSRPGKPNEGSNLKTSAWQPLTPSMPISSVGSSFGHQPWNRRQARGKPAEGEKDLQSLKLATPLRSSKGEFSFVWHFSPGIVWGCREESHLSSSTSTLFL